MRISDWSSDLCSSDLLAALVHAGRRRDLPPAVREAAGEVGLRPRLDAGRFAVHQPGDGLGVLGAQPPSAGAARERPERSEERREGKEGVSTCRFRWWQYHSKKKTKENSQKIKE